MDAALKRHPLLVTALAPVIPHLLGSAFNIWYNMTVVDPLLIAAGLKQRFIETVIVWKAIAFLVSLAMTGRPMSAQLFWHLPISFGISGFIATTQAFFLIELASHGGLFPLFFQDARPDRLKGIRPISLRMRGFMWAISASICPIGSLLLLLFAPPSPGTNPQLFGVFVGVIGAAFALFSALLIGRSVAEP